MRANKLETAVRSMPFCSDFFMYMYTYMYVYIYLAEYGMGTRLKTWRIYRLVHIRSQFLNRGDSVHITCTCMCIKQWGLTQTHAAHVHEQSITEVSEVHVHVHLQSLSPFFIPIVA